MGGIRDRTKGNQDRKNEKRDEDRTRGCLMMLGKRRRGSMNAAGGEGRVQRPSGRHCAVPSSVHHRSLNPAKKARWGVRRAIADVDRLERRQEAPRHSAKTRTRHARSDSPGRAWNGPALATTRLASSAATTAATRGTAQSSPPVPGTLRTRIAARPAHDAHPTLPRWQPSNKKVTNATHPNQLISTSRDSHPSSRR
jgi:hypothetical protein